MVDVKKEGKAVLLGIGFVLLLLVIIRYFQLPTWGIVLLLWGMQLAFAAYKYYKTKEVDFKAIGKTFIYIACLVYGIRWLSQFGIWGFLATITIVVGVILYRRWNKYMEVKHHIETMIWGKPLKDFSGRPPKVKIVR